MTPLPSISSRECVTALQRAGFYISRQKGSHIILIRDDPYAQTVVPERREIARGTLRRILRDANLSVDEFIALL